LVCHAGRLDGDGGNVTVCPTCHRIVVQRNDGDYYALKCEQRVWSSGLQRAWEKRRNVAQTQQTVMQFVVRDLGPGLVHDLVVRECVTCIPGLVERNLNVNLDPLDLDEEAAIEAELAPNPLGLRNGR
jgi:hypothetical protein